VRCVLPAITFSLPDMSGTQKKSIVIGALVMIDGDEGCMVYSLRDIRVRSKFLPH
jgi:hypothetical protein